MKYLVTLLLIGLAESCAPKAIPVAPIAPQAVRVRESVEATNNTTLTFKLKGTDGVVRTGTITLA